MSLNRRIALGVLATWFNRLVLVGLNLVVVPILFRYLGKEELGLWFLLGQSGAFIGLMDLGVTPTLTRRIALAKGRSGSSPDTPLAEESAREIADLTATGVRIYRLLSVGVFVAAWLLGLLFLAQLELSNLSHRTVWVAWTIMSLSHALGVWASVWSCVLNGLGYVGRDACANAIIGAAALVVKILVVVRGGGLIALAVVTAAGAIATRVVLLVLVRRALRELAQAAGRWNAALARALVVPAARAWLTALGAFLILQTDQYFIAYFRDPSQIPAYSAAYQLVANLNFIAISFAATSSVFVSQLWQAGEVAQVHRLVRRNVRLALSVMLCGVACLLVVGRSLTALWLGPGNFVGYPVLVAFCVMMTLETQHVAVAYASRATEDEAFAWSAMASGALNLLLTWLLIAPLGLPGVALGTLLAQLVTNNWYVVYRGLTRLRMSVGSYLRDVAAPMVVVFGAALAAGWWAVEVAARDRGDLVRVLAGMTGTGAVLAAALWRVVLSGEERRQLLAAPVLRVLRRSGANV